MTPAEQVLAPLRQAATELARRERWPAGLLPRVLLALENADPDGLDALAGRDAWAAAAYFALSEAATTEAERAAVRPLLDVATAGSKAFASDSYGLLDNAADQAEIIESRLIEGAEAAGRVLSSPWAALAAVGAVAGAAWLAMRRP